MSARIRRVTAAIERVGGPYTIGVSEGIGVFSVLKSEVARAYLTEAEWEAAARPVWLVHLAAGAAVAEEDEMEWNGLTLAVLRTVDVSLGGETVARMAVVA